LILFIFLSLYLSSLVPSRALCGETRFQS